MSLDRTTLARAVASHGRVARVVVAEARGSVPREVGAAMLVWAGGQSGTIGGGALEHEAVREARDLLASGAARRFSRKALGPELGQCCGGAVAVLVEVWEADSVAVLAEVYARPVAGDGEKPLSVKRMLAATRSASGLPAPTLVDGWFVEPVSAPRVPVWIWGAGHVGRALVATLAPLPDLALTWVDTGLDRFPDPLPEGVTALPAPEITAAVARAPAVAHHLVLTYSHALDLRLCDALLRHGFASAGLIGSDTKWARFRSRLGQIGHAGDAIGRIDCPIGDKRLGKHPQAIAVGVAQGLLIRLAQEETERPAPGVEGDRDDDRLALDA